MERVAHSATLGDNLRPNRWAVTAIFFINGAVLANWVPRIPDVKEKLALSEAELGVALLGVAAGALLSMPIAGSLVARVGSKPVVIFSSLVYCASLPLPAFAPNLLGLTLCLFWIGAANGALDVAMNTQGVAIERAYGRPVFSSFHAAFSFGGLGGALAGGTLATFGVKPAYHLLAAAVATWILALAVSRWLLPDRANSQSGRLTFARPSKRLVVLGVIAFCALLGEGAVADWSAVYLRDSLGASPGVGAMGFAAFSLAMALGRLWGDKLRTLLGPVRLVRWGGVLAAGGLGLGILVGDPVAAVVGFGLVGAGFAGVIPVVLNAAGTMHEIPAAPAIATASTIGYFGFLAGPPLIGFAAGLVTLPGALGIVVLLSACIILLANRVAPSQETENCSRV